MAPVSTTAPAASTVETIKEKARRLSILSMMATTAAGSGHPTSCMSAAELVAGTFFYAMKFDPKNPNSPAGEFRCFPNLAFRHFSVTHEDVYARRTLIHPRANRQTSTHGQPLSERTGGSVHARNARRGMALEFTRELPKGHHP